MVNKYEGIVKTDIWENIDYLDALLNFKKIVHILQSCVVVYSDISISHLCAYCYANGFRKKHYFPLLRNCYRWLMDFFLREDDLKMMYTVFFCVTGT